MTFEIKELEEYINNIETESWGGPIRKFLEEIEYADEGYETPFGTATWVKDYRENSYYINIFRLDDRHFRITGNYDSQEGVDYYYLDLDEVKPKEITVTKWVSV